MKKANRQDIFSNTEPKENSSSTQEPDIFEMILNTKSKQPAVAFASPSQTEDTLNWQSQHHEGQLAVDVLATDNDMVIVSTMAGADTKNIEVYIHNDLLTIRGKRLAPLEQSQVVNTYHEECFWGVFSRTIVLPIDVKADLARAEYNNGVLVVKIPKQKTDAKIPVTVIEE